MSKTMKTMTKMLVDAAGVAANEGRYEDAAAHCEHAARIYDMEYRMSGNAAYAESARLMTHAASLFASITG